MSKTFKVMTGDIVYLPWCKLVNMQGDLKSLDDENLRKLKGRILTKGFKAPFKVWFQTHTDKGRKLPDPKCTFKIVDGVQRTKALSSLVDDGIHVPDELPCVPVYAATLEEALDDLVGFASVYGYTSKQQAKDFILEYPDLDWLNIPETVDLPGVDMSLLVQEIRRPDKIDEDEIPEVTKAITKKGDLWILGEHRVLCGDATKKEDVERLMDGEKADMVFTDPPYNVDYGASKNPRHKIPNLVNDKQTSSQWVDFNNKLADIFKSYCLGDFYMWGAPGYEGMKARCIMIEGGLHWSATIVWKKQQLVLSPAKFQRMYEPCLYGWFNKSSFVGNRKNTEVWEIDRPLNSKLHPTMKPVELCAKGITLSSNEDNVVMDVFLGSGSTLIACEKTNRKCYGMEIDPHYCDVIVKRWEEYTGKKATRK